MLTITYIGHSTVFIEHDGPLIVTDPVFGPHILMTKRRGELPIDPGNIPDPTAVLISHAHFDHLDIHSYKYFRSSVPIITPPKIEKLFTPFLKNPVIELAHDAAFDLPGGIKVTALPVRHEGFRLAGFRYRMSNGYLIETPSGNVFFAGDTAYSKHFKEIGERFKIDIALLPIGAYSPRWFMKNRHVNPDEALKVFEALNAKMMIPIHWGTFRLSMEKPSEPVERLGRLVLEKNLSDRVKILNPGEKFSF